MIWEKQLTQVTGNSDKRVAKWQRRLDRGIAKRKKHAERWKANEDYISMKRMERHDPDVDGDRTAVNKTRAFVNNRVASFIFKAPRFIVRPVNQNGLDEIEIPGPDGPRMVARHKISEHILNFIVSQPSFGADRTSRRLGRSGLVSLGVAKTGYKADFGDGYHTERDYAYDDETSSWLRDPALSTEVDGRGVPENLIPSPEGYGRPYPIRPTSERWFVDWVPAERMVYDPDGENEFYDHDWVACEYYWRIEDVKKNPRFRKKVTKNLKGTVKAELLSEDEILAAKVGGDTKLDDDEEYARVFEIYDIRNKEVLWYADGCADFLAIEDYPEGVSHSPYDHFAPDENHAEWYPHSVVADLIPINQEIDKLHLLDLQAALGNIPKWGYIKGQVDDDQMDALMSPVPNEAVKFNENVVDPRKALFAIDRQYTPPDFYARMQQLERDFDEVAGQSAETRGRASSKLATGINEISQANKVREDDYRAQFSAVWRSIGKKLLDSIQANMDVPTAVAIEGADGEMFVGTIDRKMIKGDFDVSVDVEDMMPRSTDMELSQIIQIMTMFGQYPFVGLDDAVSGVILDKARINSSSVREGLEKIARFSAQMQFGPAAGENQPDAQGGAGPAQNYGDLAAQMGGG